MTESTGERPMTDRENVERLLEAAGFTRTKGGISPREQFWEGEGLCVVIDEDLESAELRVSLKKLPHFLSPAVQTLTDDEKAFLEETRATSDLYPNGERLGLGFALAESAPRLLAIIDRLSGKEEVK